ncbi:MAG TPA: sugar O-acetyltransferase [Fibrobacteria bacterium]|nr:sugar O-acetyltransferase [Fibrobacteria bacterium]HOX50894.1 sugar O-acetyltransferase [Fibrobacteria bacterium]
MPTEREKMVSGELYDPCDPELTALRRAARLATEAFNRSSTDDLERRVSMLKGLFGSTGASVFVEPSFRCDYGFNIHVGDNFCANFDCVILDCAEVRIGKNCMIAPQVGIYTAFHPLDAASRISGKELAAPVSIGDNCWIGGHATINPGVTLGNGVVVASGAVVTGSFGDNVVLAGVPARVIRTLT